MTQPGQVEAEQPVDADSLLVHPSPDPVAEELTARFLALQEDHET